MATKLEWGGEVSPSGLASLSKPISLTEPNLYSAGDYGGVRLRVYREAVQDVQGPEVSLHADGVLPGRRALDYSQVRTIADLPV